MSLFVVLTPSRGLVHSRTIEAVQANVASAEAAGHTSCGWLLTHDLPIPDCHERVTEMGMATGAEYLWLLEEDMVPPKDALIALIAMGADAAAVDYPVGWPQGWIVPDGLPKLSTKGTWSCVNTHHHGTDADPLEWAPFGCTLVHRRVYEALARPWYDIGKQTKIWHQGNVSSFTEVVGSPYSYGGLDVEFGHRIINAGFRIVKVPDMLAGHALIKTLGRPQSNDGAHEIVVRDKLEWKWGQ